VLLGDAVHGIDDLLVVDCGHIFSIHEKRGLKPDGVDRYPTRGGPKSINIVAD
jgi:hypothetical protein